MDALLARLDEEVDMFHSRFGGLPRAVEADDLLREIWIEDTFHSSALEGNPLSRGQVQRLLDKGEASGPLTQALEVQGYARAASWVYESAPGHRLKDGVPLRVIQLVHRMLVEPAWAIEPPLDGSRPGDWRRRGIRIAGSNVKTTPPIALDGAIRDWIEASGPFDPSSYSHELFHVAHLHAWFERIHPFADGNGRVGRLLMNFMLIQRGYPPAVLVVTSRDRYLDALARADQGSVGSLTELIARAIESSMNKFIIPRLAGDARLVPLAALAETSEFGADYLRTLAVAGRLRAVREGRIWLSSRAWLDDYKRSRSPRGRTPGRAKAGR